MPRRHPSFGLLLVCLVSAACSASYPTAPTKAEPVALMIRYAEPRGRIGTTTASNRYLFSALTVDGDGAFETVTDRAVWMSSNEAVARPVGASSHSATFLPVGPGTADAIVRFGGMEATARMVVVDTALLDSYPRLNITSAGTRPQAFVREGPASAQSRNVTGAADWSSSDTTVATISPTGEVTRVGIGTTVITATFNGLTDWYWLSLGPILP